MHVLARLDHQGRPPLFEKNRRRPGPFAYKPLPLSSRSLYSVEDIIGLLEPHVRPDGEIDTVYIDFENERIPLCHQGEVRLAASLAAVYHNSLVQTNTGMKAPNHNLLCHQHDDPGQFPSPSMTEEIESNDAPAEIFPIPDDWDDDEFGDRAYHDSTFETNEDLLPWNMRGVREDERWGLWS